MTSENVLLIARINDLITASNKRHFPVFLGFLNEHEISVASQYLRKEKSINYRFFGGYNSSERCILAVAQCNFDIEEYYYPITGLCFRYKTDYKLSHRDFLGSLMGLGIKRESVGDILTGNGVAIVFVKDEIKEYVVSQIQKIGNVGVTIEEWDSIELPVKNEFEEINCTVSSARLDSIVSAVVLLSREKSSALIKQGLVFVNAFATENVSYTVKSGDKISVRGKGKFIVGEFSGVTKKGRLKLTVKKYK
ncbi:MAG: YlmH/Sll1252 family protein [Acutalibacteraceae bacterium]|nr:YlmH/Sll1252 family protein [Acutalibacteraceae bacterium]